MFVEPSPHKSVITVPSVCCRNSQSPPKPMMRAVPAGAPVDRIQKATVPASGGLNGAFVAAIPLAVPLVSSALLLPAQSLVHEAPPESVALLPMPELSAAEVPEPSANFHQPMSPDPCWSSAAVSGRL